MYLSREALEALNKGTKEGTITDNEEQIIDIILEQEIVSYCSSKGSYSFDYTDIIEEQGVFQWKYKTW